MFRISHMYVAALQAEQRNAVAAERLVPRSQSRVAARANAAAKSAWSLLSGPAERPQTPILNDYPFRVTHAAAR
jgi:hypothetical protein